MEEKEDEWVSCGSESLLCLLGATTTCQNGGSGTTHLDCLFP